MNSGKPGLWFCRYSLHGCPDGAEWDFWFCSLFLCIACYVTQRIFITKSVIRQYVYYFCIYSFPMDVFVHGHSFRTMDLVLPTPSSCSSAITRFHGFFVPLSSLIVKLFHEQQEKPHGCMASRDILQWRHNECGSRTFACTICLRKAYDQLPSGGTVSCLWPSPECRQCELLTTVSRVLAMWVSSDRLLSASHVKDLWEAPKWIYVARFIFTGFSHASDWLDDSAPLIPIFIPLRVQLCDTIMKNLDRVASWSLINQTRESVFVATIRNNFQERSHLGRKSAVRSISDSFHQVL